MQAHERGNSLWHASRASTSWDVDRECDDGRHVDVDVDELRLHRLGAPKMVDSLAAALRMMKGKNG